MTREELEVEVQNLIDNDDGEGGLTTRIMDLIDQFADYVVECIRLDAETVDL